MVFKLLVFGAVVAIAAPAIAQQAPTTYHLPRLQSYQLDAPSERTAPSDTDLTPRRARRAEALAVLINAGDCTGALALAQKEGDQRLTVRVTQICSTLTAPALGTTEQTQS